jgi:4,5-dihydroxyphthalate decarboxylase
MITKERPKDLWDWTAIPIFFSKAALGLNSYANAQAGIQSAADLKGKRFGIPDYTMTAGLWFRAQLKALYDILPQDMEWWVGRVGEHSHGAQMGMQENPPQGVTLKWADHEGQINEMLQSGELDAAFPAGSADIDPSTGKVRRLFEDGGRQFFADFQQKVGFLPVNHTVVVQRKLVEKEPWVAEALFEAFEASKQEAYRRDRASSMVFPRGREDFDWQESVFGPDPFKSGFKANRDMLAMAAEQSNIDGLTRQRANIDELYWQSLRNT